MESYKAILHKPNDDSAAFWEGCQREEFLLQLCNACGHRYYYPRLACPKCSSLDVGWTPASGRGEIYSYTHVYVSFYGDNWTSEIPYTNVLVDLEEGPRLTSRLIGDGRDEVEIGDAVEIIWIEAKSQPQKIPFFQKS